MTRYPVLLCAALAALAACQDRDTDPDDYEAGGGETVFGTPATDPATPTTPTDPTEPATDPGEATQGMGLIGLYALSTAGTGEGQVTAEIGRVEVHRIDKTRPPVNDPYAEGAGTWHVVSEAAGTIALSEAETAAWPLGEANVAAGNYDLVRIEILGGTFNDGAGQEIEVDASDVPLVLSHSFCVQAGFPTQLDIELKGTTSSVSATSWAFQFDPVVHDHQSCDPQDDDTEQTIDDGTVDETEENPIP